jgi:hypothetical protein
VQKAIDRIWPDGIVEMPLDPDESYFFELHPKLSRALRRIRNTGLVYEREAHGGPAWWEESDPKRTHRMKSSDHVRITRFSSAPTAKALHSKPKPMALQNPSS